MASNKTYTINISFLGAVLGAILAGSYANSKGASTGKIVAAVVVGGIAGYGAISLAAFGFSLATVLGTKVTQSIVK